MAPALRASALVKSSIGRGTSADWTATLYPTGPGLSVLAQGEGLSQIATLETDLDAPAPGFLFYDGGQFRVLYACGQQSICGNKRGIRLKN